MSPSAEDAGKAHQSKLVRPSLLKVSIYVPPIQFVFFKRRFTYAQRMSKSHVSGGFWLGGLSGSQAFLSALPRETTDIAFEHKGEHWPVRWLFEKAGMSGGWRWATSHAPRI